MKISIITATYNSAKTIRDTLESVKSQCYLNVEHIIVDGGSTDNTLEIVKKYPHVKKIISEPDKGIYDAINKGIRIASGDVVGTLGSDDFYPHNMVMKIVADTFTQYDVDSIYGDKIYVNRFDIKKIVRYWQPGSYKKENFLYGWMPPHQSFYVKKKYFDLFGLYQLSYKIAGDYELLLRFLYKNNLTSKYVPNILIHMRSGGISSSNIKNKIILNRECRKAWKDNQLTPKFYTMLLKPLRNIPQLFVKPKM